MHLHPGRSLAPGSQASRSSCVGSVAFGNPGAKPPHPPIILCSLSYSLTMMCPQAGRPTVGGLLAPANPPARETPWSFSPEAGKQTHHHPAFNEPLKPGRLHGTSRGRSDTPAYLSSLIYIKYVLNPLTHVPSHRLSVWCVCFVVCLVVVVRVLVCVCRVCVCVVGV